VTGYMNVKQFCDHLGVGRSALYKAMNELRAKGVKFQRWRTTGALRFTTEDAKMFIGDEPDPPVKRTFRKRTPPTALHPALQKKRDRRSQRKQKRA